MSVKKPAYLTLYESLREEIISGIRPFGSRLPSRRILARDRGVSAITAEHSIELLCEEGYAESRPRSGYFVAYRAADGRIYFECNGREHSISIVESPNDPSEAGGESYVLRMGYNKAARDIKMTRPEMWGVLNGNYKRLELDGFGKEDNTVICRMADELPPATEEMERRLAEYDSMMEKSVG